MSRIFGGTTSEDCSTYRFLLPPSLATIFRASSPLVELYPPENLKLSEEQLLAMALNNPETVDRIGS